jgi:Family of unknown function (DUF6508)
LQGWRGLRIRFQPLASLSVNGRGRIDVLTAVVRGDRFCEGMLGDAFDRGILTAIVQRARARC